MLSWVNLDTIFLNSFEKANNLPEIQESSNTELAYNFCLSPACQM